MKRMPINKNYMIVFDFETTGKNPQVCEPIEIGALVVNPQTLEVLPDKFLSDVAPSTEDIIEAKALEVNGFTMERIRKAPPQEHVWKLFQKFVSKYNVKGYDSYPIPVGCNIKKFDMIIADRLCEKYGMVDKGGEPKLFNKKFVHDMYEILFPWFENRDDLISYSMDNMRDYFGLSRDKSHTALKDCEDTYKIYSRFLSFTRKMSKKYNFKDAFKNKE